MPHVRIETSVPRHPKFLKAGPVASWLWLCGNCYCQDGLTDGFIPREVVPTLGLPVNRTMLRDAIAKLVEVRLWETRDGGWQVHDYLSHNRSADHVRTIRATNKENAKRPRRCSESLNGSVSDSMSESVDKSLSDAVVVVVDAAVDERPKKELSDEQIGSEFQRFQQAFHPSGRRGGPLPFGYFERARRGGVEFSAMLAALENHKQSAQWLGGKVPSLVTWLQDQWWLTRLDPPGTPVADSKLPAWARRAKAAQS